MFQSTPKLQGIYFLEMIVTPFHIHISSLRKSLGVVYLWILKAPCSQTILQKTNLLGSQLNFRSSHMCPLGVVTSLYSILLLLNTLKWPICLSVSVWLLIQKEEVSWKSKSHLQCFIFLHVRYSLEFNCWKCFRLLILFKEIYSWLILLLSAKNLSTEGTAVNKLDMVHSYAIVSFLFIHPGNVYSTPSRYALEMQAPQISNMQKPNKSLVLSYRVLQLTF